MATPKLTYFNGRGRGEIVRMTLAATGMKVRILKTVYLTRCSEKSEEISNKKYIWTTIDGGTFPRPATDSGRTPCTLQCSRPPPPPLLTPPVFPVPDRGTRPVPVPVTCVSYNSLLWMCTLNSLTWPDLTWGNIRLIETTCLDVLHIHWTKTKTLPICTNSICCVKEFNV